MEALQFNMSSGIKSQRSSVVLLNGVTFEPNPEVIDDQQQPIEGGVCIEVIDGGTVYLAGLIVFNVNADTWIKASQGSSVRNINPGSIVASSRINDSLFNPFVIETNSNVSIQDPDFFQFQNSTNFTNEELFTQTIVDTTSHLYINEGLKIEILKDDSDIKGSINNVFYSAGQGGGEPYVEINSTDTLPTVSSDNSIAIGPSCKIEVSSAEAIAFGVGAEVGGSEQFTFTTSYYSSYYSTTYTYTSTTTIDYVGNKAIAIGNNAKSKAVEAIAIGAGAEVKDDKSIVIGSNSNIFNNSPKNVAIGPNVVVEQNSAGNIAIGDQAQISSDTNSSIQLGTGINNISNTLKFQTVTIANQSGLVTNFTNPSKYPLSSPSSVNSHLNAIHNLISPFIKENYTIPSNNGGAVLEAPVMRGTDNLIIGRNADVEVSGLRSIGIGLNCKVGGTDTISIGTNSETSIISNTISIGTNAQGVGGLAIGPNTTNKASTGANPTSRQSLAIGINAKNLTDGEQNYDYNISLGIDSLVEGGSYNVCVGKSSTIDGFNNVVIGRGITVKALSGVTIGQESDNKSSASVVIGYQNVGSESTVNTIAIGREVIANASTSINIGYYNNSETLPHVFYGKNNNVTNGRASSFILGNLNTNNAELKPAYVLGNSNLITSTASHTKTDNGQNFATEMILGFNNEIDGPTNAGNFIAGFSNVIKENTDKTDAIGTGRVVCLGYFNDVQDSVSVFISGEDNLIKEIDNLNLIGASNTIDGTPTADTLNYNYNNINILGNENASTSSTTASGNQGFVSIVGDYNNVKGSNRCSIVGYSSEIKEGSNSSVVIGNGGIIEENTESAVQISLGTNNTPFSLQFRNYTIANSDGVQVRTGEGTPNFVTADGTLYVDTTGLKLYFRAGGQWIAAN